jgi:hypothetical protein
MRFFDSILPLLIKKVVMEHDTRKRTKKGSAFYSMYITVNRIVQADVMMH